MGTEGTVMGKYFNPFVKHWQTFSHTLKCTPRSSYLNPNSSLVAYYYGLGPRSPSADIPMSVHRGAGPCQKSEDFGVSNLPSIQQADLLLGELYYATFFTNKSVLLLLLFQLFSGH